MSSSTEYGVQMGRLAVKAATSKSSELVRLDRELAATWDRASRSLTPVFSPKFERAIREYQQERGL